MQQALGNPALISLAAGFVDPASLPVEVVEKAAAELLGDPAVARRALQYGTTTGDISLRRKLVRRLEREEGRPEGAFEGVEARTVVTTGSQQLLYLISEALLDPGDIVLVESPTYFVYMGVLQSRGARVIGIETDAGGLRLDSLEETLVRLDRQGELDRVKLIYSITEHSNPTGLSLAADRRPGLVALARKWSRRFPIYILEDAAYRGLAFDGVEPPSVWSHDEDGGHVILARTFSKTFSPGMKLGWGVLPESLLGAVLHLKGQHDFGTSNFSQMLIDRVLEDGTYDRQIARLRQVYRQKCAILVGALTEHLGECDGVGWTHPAGGLYIWLKLPEELDTGPDGPLFAKAVERGVLYVPGVYGYAGEPAPAPRNFARLCYGVPTTDQLVEGARRLAAARAECLQTVP
jgi:2-aminoadipate transaminase